MRTDFYPLNLLLTFLIRVRENENVKLIFGGVVMIGKTVRKLAAAIALSAIIVGATPASALVIALNNTGGVGAGTQAAAGFRAAASFWERVLTNNITVNLNVNFAPLAPGVLGSTGSTTNGVFLQPFVELLQASGVSRLDQIATANAQSFRPSVDGPGRGAYDALISGPRPDGTGVQTAGGLVTRLDNDGSRNNDSLSVNTAVIKAIGAAPTYAASNTTQADGSISFSSNFAFDFDPTDGISSGQFDFVGIAIHEIGHALGFRSGVDVYDGNTGFTGNLNNFTFLTQLDLFRYSAASTALGVNDWQIGGNPYFSIDGGQTNLFGNFLSSGRSFGDGQQASHWRDAPRGAPQLGILDPTIASGQQGIITTLDLAAFDAIGYNIAYDVLRNPNTTFTTRDRNFGTIPPVPEPATWLMLITGFGLVGSALRRRRQQETLAAA